MAETAEIGAFLGGEIRRIANRFNGLLPCRHLNGVQVVGGSNPRAPTKSHFLRYLWDFSVKFGLFPQQPGITR